LARAVNNLSNIMHGSYPKGVGWYRTSFTLPAAAGGASFLRIEGCLNDCQVFVNGVFATRRFAAYSGFTVPLPPGKPNERTMVAVRADNSRGPGGPMGPLCTPLRNPGTLSRPGISHCKPSWDPLILASGTFG
jgi:hypothetical protein